METQSSSGLLLSRKRRREGSNGETEEGEKLGKILRCTVVSQLHSSPFFELHIWLAVANVLCLCVHLWLLEHTCHVHAHLRFTD